MAKTEKATPKKIKPVGVKKSKKQNKPGKLNAPTPPGKLTVKGLVMASAEYNPRTISDKRLRALKTSYETYGDLSGVVLNRRTNTLVSGHQRLKTLAGKKTRVTTEKHTDSYGTVEVGHIEVLEGEKLTRIPLRIVDWSDRKAEMAANIAANAHGGEFDANKLAKLIEEIEPKEQFEIEALGLDAVTIRQLSKKDKPEGDDEDDDSEDAEEGFKEYGADSFELQHQCPRCKFRF